MFMCSLPNEYLSFPRIISTSCILQKHHKFRLKYRSEEYTQALQFLPHQRLQLINSEVSGRGKQINLIVLSDNRKKGTFRDRNGCDEVT